MLFWHGCMSHLHEHKYLLSRPMNASRKCQQGVKKLRISPGRRKIIISRYSDIFPYDAQNTENIYSQIQDTAKIEKIHVVFNETIQGPL